MTAPFRKEDGPLYQAIEAALTACGDKTGVFFQDICGQSRSQMLQGNPADIC